VAECPRGNELSDYVAGLVSGSQAEALAEHIRGCDACRRQAERLREEEVLAHRLRNAVNPSGHETLGKRLQERMAGHYEVLESLGEGASGVVFKARDVHLNRLVAIKCPADRVQRGRLVSLFGEARILATINHPNVAAIYSLSEDAELPFMVMEFVDGCPIDEAVAQAPLEQRLKVFRQVLRGVSELHRLGIVHRDLKPGNILVDRSGNAKVLDLGIAEKTWETAPGLSVPTAKGTPAYLAPEQSRGEVPRPTTDVFALGIILFEILTGQRPFTGTTVQDVIQAIRKADPPLPRTLNSEIPGPLQAICLTALEKNPAHRYPSAREFLHDLERFVRGDQVVANPSLLANILEHGIDRHVGDLARWQADRLISSRESDYFAERYNRLREREEFWVLDSRRISFAQVALHLGAWSCVVSAFLMLFFKWAGLSKATRLSLPLGVFVVLATLGGYLWHRQTRRVGLVLLMAACLTWPLLGGTLFVTMEWHIGHNPGKDVFLGSVPVETPTENGPDTRLIGITNDELLLVAGTWTLLSLLLWYRTRTSAFALIWGLTALAFATAVFVWMGLRDWERDTIAVWYLVPGAMLIGLAMALDLKWRQFYFAAPLYVMGVLVMLGALTYVAIEGPTTKWLGVEAWAQYLGIERLVPDRQIKYSFIINGAAFLALGLVADRSRTSWWLRKIAIILFWLAPSHMLVPIRLLAHEWAVLPGGWTIPEVLLPIGALAFVFASVPKQMKSFFFSGLGYLAVAAQRLTAAHFEDVFAWPVALAVAGIGLALVAWRRPALFDRSGASGPAVPPRTSSGV